MRHKANSVAAAIASYLGRHKDEPYWLTTRVLAGLALYELYRLAVYLMAMLEVVP